MRFIGIYNISYGVVYFFAVSCIEHIYELTSQLVKIFFSQMDSETQNERWRIFWTIERIIQY